VEANILSCENIQDILVHKCGQVVTIRNIQNNFNEWNRAVAKELFSVDEENMLGFITN
jgi:hypothetical protein